MPHSKEVYHFSLEVGFYYCCSLNKDHFEPSAILNSSK